MTFVGKRQTLFSWSSLLVIFLLIVENDASWGSNDRIKLTDVNTLTLYHGKMTSSRRSYAVSQLKCVGGSAGCGAFVPQVVQCSNKGTDGFDVQWECKTDMDNAYRFGQIEVVCEGYDYPEDPYILRGSCGLEYTLELTKEGHQRQNGGHNYYGSDTSKNTYSKSYIPSNKESVIGNIIMFAMVAVLAYGFYRTCLADNQHQYSSTDDDGSDPNQRRGWFGGNGYGAPPPPGFRPEYSSFDDGCGRPRSNASAGGGFWTGAATGGLLGYMFGNRNSGYSNTGYHRQPYHQSPPPSGGWESSNFSSFGSGSTGTRTATGFGGTRRR